MLFTLITLISSLKQAKDGRWYFVLDGNVKYLPKGTIQVIEHPKGRPMTARQVVAIRRLYKETRHLLNKAEKARLIERMQRHNDGTNILPVAWGTQAINKLVMVRRDRS